MSEELIKKFQIEDWTHTHQLVVSQKFCDLAELLNGIITEDEEKEIVLFYLLMARNMANVAIMLNLLKLGPLARMGEIKGKLVFIDPEPIPPYQEEDVNFLVGLFRTMGYEVSKKDMREAWLAHSDSHAAGWLDVVEGGRSFKYFYNVLEPYLKESR